MILAVLQARFSSTRLPSKVLLPLLGQPMLARQIERIQKAALIDKLVVATSLDEADGKIKDACEAIGVACFRGSLDDVLDRFYQAAHQYQPSHVVRLTGDCPLADYALIDDIISFHVNGRYDYSSNTVEPTFPDGLDVEIMTFDTLKTCWRNATLPSQREHVTQYVLQNRHLFTIGNWKTVVDLSQLRWTVDEPEDFQLITQIYEGLYHRNPDFRTPEVLAYLAANPHLADLNNSYYRNEGLQKSLQEDLRLKNKEKEEG